MKVSIIVLLISGFITSMIFLILKAADVIDWNWVFITLPILIGWGIPLVFFLIFGVIWGFALFVLDR
jgi:hypothetical protein